MTTQRFSSALAKTVIFGIGNLLFIICFVCFVHLGPSNYPKDGSGVLLISIIILCFSLSFFITLPTTLAALLFFLFRSNKASFWLVFFVGGVTGLLIAFGLMGIPK